MKKLLLLLLLAINVVLAHADFVHLDLSGKNISIEEVVSHFNEWFGTGDSEFVLFFDETDEIGMRDMDYQQYIDGIEVENSALYVHSYNGIVTLINGDVMPQQKTPNLSSKIQPKKAVQIVNENDSVNITPQKIIIHKLNNDGVFEYFTTYKIITNSEEIYVDCTTGEIIKSLPLSVSSTLCTVETKYNAIQNVMCETNTNGDYVLRNDSKNIRTLYANMNNLDDWAIPITRYTFTNQTTNWRGNYLTAVVITAVHNAGWWNTLIGDTSPDLYIKITDDSDNLLYVSDYKEDCGTTTPFFVTFRIPKMIKIPIYGGYKIEIWDEDLGEDDKGSIITLNSNVNGSHIWGSISSNTEGYCVISDWHPAMDIQWGLEKTWDFYNSEFDLQGFDGNNSITRAILHSPGNVENIAAEAKHSRYNKAAITPNNAFAYSEQDVNGAYLYFGIGNEKGESLVDLNCVTHEFTHLVTAYRPKKKLVYEGESGSLNEGYSDVMAVSLEARLTGSINWLYGHGVQQVGWDGNIYNYCRDLANPKAGGPEGPKPDTYGKGPWLNPNPDKPSEENDYGGVHVNNSIFTHWFYILCEGKTGVNDNQHSYSVNPIGLDKALKIIWKMHRKYLPPQSTFAIARKYAIESAKNLYPNEVNVLRSVTNAWHAVGVGDKYVEEPQDSNLKPGKYVIVANREEDSKNNWYYMTSDLGTASTKRFQAVSASTENIDAIATSNLDAQYIWELEADGSNWKLKNGDQYATWKSGNSANLDATGKSFTFDITDNQVVVHFNDGSAERYLSLHTGNDYFAFYGNTGQIEQLYFLPYEDKTTPPTPERECKSVPYTETFASSQGDFTVYNALLPSGFTSIWNWDSRYGMVAKCIKGSTKYASEAYLISPCVELPENSQCVLTFSHAAKFFQDTKQMSLWISTNYDETNPELADWDRLVIPSYPTGDNWNWFESGAIDLSKYSGQNVNIAFGYTSTESYAPQWEIKNFAIQKTTTTDLEDVKIEQLTTTKILRDGQLLILRDGKTYNVMGQEI